MILKTSLICLSCRTSTGQGLNVPTLHHCMQLKKDLPFFLKVWCTLEFFLILTGLILNCIWLVYFLHYFGSLNLWCTSFYNIYFPYTLCNFVFSNFCKSFCNQSRTFFIVALGNLWFISNIIYIKVTKFLIWFILKYKFEKYGMFFS